MDPTTRWNCGLFMVHLLMVSLVAHQSQAWPTCFPAIFNFGDDDGDTGGMHASFPNLTSADISPYGQSYFGFPQGRNSDGRLIIDFITQAYGMRNLDPYLQSVTSDFSQGVNFATWGAVARIVNYLSPFPLHTQVQQFQLFQQEVRDVLDQSYALLVSRGLLGNISELDQGLQLGVHPYKRLYKELFKNGTTGITMQATNHDPGIHRALEAASRLPLPEYFDQGLYLISIGTNDLRRGISQSQTPDQIVAYLPDVVAAVTTAVQDLYNVGARNVIVAGVGNIGCSPAELTMVDISSPFSDLDSWGCLTQYNTIARNYNSLLQQALGDLMPKLSSANITFLDTYQLQHNLLFNYSNNGMVEPIKACCGVTSKYNYDPQVLCGERAIIANLVIDTETCADPSEYVIWDGIHYTESANRYFANQIFSGQFFDPPFSLVRTNCIVNLI